MVCQHMARLNAKLVVLISLALVFFALLTICMAYLAHVPIAVVQGRSMLPLFREGDMVFIAKADPHEIKERDIIVFWAPNNRTLIIHRVIRVVRTPDNFYYVTKGDNNPLADIYYPMGVPYNKVVGKVVSINGVALKIPYVGHLTLIFRDILTGLRG